MLPPHHQHTTYTFSLGAVINNGEGGATNWEEGWGIKSRFTPTKLRHGKNVSHATEGKTCEIILMQDTSSHA